MLLKEIFDLYVKDPKSDKFPKIRGYVHKIYQTTHYGVGLGVIHVADPSASIKILIRDTRNWELVRELKNLYVTLSPVFLRADNGVLVGTLCQTSRILVMRSKPRLTAESGICYDLYHLPRFSGKGDRRKQTKIKDFFDVKPKVHGNESKGKEGLMKIDEGKFSPKKSRIMMVKFHSLLSSKSSHDLWRNFITFWTAWPFFKMYLLFEVLVITSFYKTDRLFYES